MKEEIVQRGRGGWCLAHDKQFNELQHKFATCDIERKKLHCRGEEECVRKGVHSTELQSKNKGGGWIASGCWENVSFDSD